ncbi:MAG: response regulator [Deltaproteobacteria bacterium]|nr:response regulator [Deltaproteobacteria bacterium]
MNVRTRWLIVVAMMLLFFAILTVLFPVMGGSANVLVTVAPVVATLFFGFRVGSMVAAANWVGAILIFTQISTYSPMEGLVRLPLPFLVTILICYGTDRLNLFLKQRKHAEQLQRVSEDRYRLIFQHSADGILLLDNKGVIIDASPGVTAHLGYLPAALIGTRIQDAGFCMDDDLIEIVNLIENDTRAEIRETEVRARDGNGNPIFLSITLSRIDEDTSTCTWICLMKNITERREIMEKLQEAQKMKAIGRLAGGVAHDLNNILNAIIGSAHAHRHEIAGFKGNLEDLDNITVACNRGAKLTRNLLGFARKKAVTRELFSLNEVVERVLAITNRTSLKTITQKVNLEPNLPLICGDPHQIENALMNIFLNAQDAMTQNGVLNVETSSDDGVVSVHIEDNGKGMDEETRRRVFEPFFTTKPVGKGTGLGLSMVYGTIHAHGGTVEIHSVENEGTTVTLLFPQAADVLAANGEKASHRLDAGDTDASILATLTVLLVDDEPLVLRAGVRMLQAMGCTVLSARNGREAIETYRTHGDDISLVILDLIMPEMDGAETLARLRELNTTLPILLASGYSQEFERLESLRDCNNCVFLPKPYHPEALIAAVREVLQHRAA